MDVEMKPVFSSHIAAIGYDPDAQILFVDYQNGNHGAYGDVPADVARDVMQAPSIGSAIHRQVRNRFGFKYL